MTPSTLVNSQSEPVNVLRNVAGGWRLYTNPDVRVAVEGFVLASRHDYRAPPIGRPVVPCNADLPTDGGVADP